MGQGVHYLGLSAQPHCPLSILTLLLAPPLGDCGSGWFRVVRKWYQMQGVCVNVTVLCVFARSCICVYACVCVCMYLFVCVLCVCMCICVYASVCVLCVYLCVSVCTRVHVHVHVYWQEEPLAPAGNPGPVWPGKQDEWAQLPVSGGKAGGPGRALQLRPPPKRHP